MLEKGRDPLEGAHLKLHDSEADKGFLSEFFGARLMGDVDPLQQGGVGLGLGIGIEIVDENFLYVEIVAELEGHDGVIDFLPLYAIDVLPGSEVLVLGVVRHASSGDNGAEVEFFADLLADIVEPAPEPEALEIRVNTDLDPVKDVALGVEGVLGVGGISETGLGDKEDAVGNFIGERIVDALRRRVFRTFA